MSIIAVVATGGKDNVIGNQGEIPWDVPEDRKFFRRMATKTTVVMGRETYEGIGDGKVPGKVIAVVSSDPNLSYQYAEVISDPVEAIDIAKDEDTDLTVAGGQRIYEAMLPYVDQVYWTKVSGEYEGDRFWPGLGDDWKVTTGRTLSKEPLATVFCYTRK